MTQVATPAELHFSAGTRFSAGTFQAVTASVLLLTSAAAIGQPPNPADKMDPKVAQRLQDQAQAALAKAQAQPPADGSKAAAPAKPAAAQPEAAKDMGGDGKAQVKVTEHNTVDLHVKDESIGNVLELLSIQSQKNIIPSKNVSGKVSADLFGVTFFEALDAILHVNGFQYVEKGNFIYVYTREEYLEIQKALSKRVAKVMHLNYLNAIDAESFVKPLLSQGGDIKTAQKTPEYQVTADAPTGKDDYALGAVLVVIDYEENIAAIEKLLAEIDTRPSQVLVEATILETQVVEANAFGVDFSIIGDLDFLEFVNLGGPTGAAQALIRGGNGTTGGLSPGDNRGGAVSTSPGNVAAGRSTVKIGVVAGPIGVFLRALDDVSDFTIISSPKLLALNRMPSRVLVGQRVGYLNTTATETSTTQTVQFLDTGTTLYFRPFVSNTGEIRMELKPKVASATIRDAGNGQGGIVSIPDESTQEITTNVIVKDGNTIVLGGLFVENSRSFRKQVPFFGDIPLIGAAFRGHDDSLDRRELIFLIRPSIVGETALAMQGVDMKNEIERIRAGQRQGLLPFSREKMTATLNVEAETAAREGRTEEALWKLQRSLSLNSRQPDAIRLREKITSQQERWPSGYLLDGVINGEINKQLDGIPSAPDAKHLVPQGSVDFPRTPTKGAAPRTEGSIFDRTLQDALAATANEPTSNGEPAPQPVTTFAEPNFAQPANEGNQPNNSGGEVSAASAFTTESAPATEAPAHADSQDQQPALQHEQAAVANNTEPAPNAAATGSEVVPVTTTPAHPEDASGDPMGEQAMPAAPASAPTPVAATPAGHEAAFNEDPTQPLVETKPVATQPAPQTPAGSAPVAAPANGTSNARSIGKATLSPMDPQSSSSAQRRATRMSARAFFQTLFFGGGTEPSSPAVTGAPSDAPQQQQEMSK